jgi:hypothetical protein
LRSLIRVDAGEPEKWAKVGSARSIVDYELLTEPLRQLFTDQSCYNVGRKVGLKPGTLRSWFAAWKRVQSRSESKTETNSSTPPAINPDGLCTTSEAVHL